MVFFQTFLEMPKFDEKHVGKHKILQNNLKNIFVNSLEFNWNIIQITDYDKKNWKDMQ